jgi:DNA-binding GntR family transcriptional regulator
MSSRSIRTIRRIAPPRVVRGCYSRFGVLCGYCARSWSPADPAMTDVTHILAAIAQGDPHAAEALLPPVYDEMRKLAARTLAQEKPGHTLQATALVHEAT